MFGTADADMEPMLESLGYSVLCLRNDSRLTIAYAGESFYRALGYRKGEISALLAPGPAPVLRNDPPVDWGRVRQEIAASGCAGPELRLIKKDGHHIWMSFRASFQEKDGEGYFRGIANDITLTRRSLRMQREQAAELQALTANVPCGVLRCRDDENLTMEFISEGFCILTGYQREELARRFRNRYLLMVDERDRPRLMEETPEGPRRDRENTYRLRRRDGRLLWIFDRTRRYADCNGHVCLYSVLMDITASKKAEEELAASEERYRLILEHVTDPICDFDFKTGEIYFSPAFVHKFGGDFCERYRKDIGGFLEGPLVFEGDRQGFRDGMKRLVQRACVSDWECRLRRQDGAHIWCSIHPTLFRDGQGGPSRIIMLISDIDSRKRETIVLRQKAEHDLLTGLYNRMTTMSLVDEALAKSEPENRHALFVVDIDNFKEVNDHLGHLVGDKLIVHTASALRRQFREDDVVGRVGGDEFVVFLKNVNSQVVLSKAERVLQICRTLPSGQECGIPVSGSIGIALFPPDGSTYEELFRKADNAMYAAKNSGKGSFRVYVEGIEAIAHNGGKY